MATDKQIEALARKFEAEYDKSDGDVHPWEMIARFLFESGVLEKVKLIDRPCCHRVFSAKSCVAQNAAVDKLIGGE